MGIKRKIRLGLIMIGTLLFLSGIISSMELVRLNRATTELLTWNRQTIELTKNMLDLAQEQNIALLLSVNDSTQSYDSIIAANSRAFAVLIEESKYYTDSTEMAKIINAYNRYNMVATQMPENLTIHWFTNVYRTPYYELTYEIKEFMVLTQNHLIDFTADLENNAYRASMVGIIALGAGIFLIFIFYYMINLFFIKPVLDMNKGLKNYLSSNLPFNVNVKSDDEMQELKDNISQLIVSAKNQTKQ